MQDAIVLAAGLVLRCMSHHGKNLIPWYVRYVLVHSTELSTSECVFIFNKYTEIDMAQQYPHCPRLTRLVAFPFTLFDSDAASAVATAHFMFPIMATVAQLCVCLLLRILCSTVDPPHERGKDCSDENDSRKDSEGGTVSAWPLPALVYWLSPVTVLGSALSPFPSLLHALLITTIAVAPSSFCSSASASSASRAKSIIHCICFLLVCSLIQCLLPESLPLLLVLFSSSVSFLTSLLPCGSLLVGAICLLSVGCLWLTPAGLQSSALSLIGGNACTKQEYYPGFGIVWYLQAQVFDKYTEYFSSLVRLQPLLYVGPLTTRLPPRVSAFVMLAIILLLCRREASFADLVFVLCCFMTAFSATFKTTLPNTSSLLKLPMRMRHLSLLAPLLLLSCAGTPLMLMLWVQHGTGNANFVFFLGLAGSLAVTVSIVEFARSAMQQRQSHDKAHAAT